MLVVGLPASLPVHLLDNELFTFKHNSEIIKKTCLGEVKDKHTKKW